MLMEGKEERTLKIPDSSTKPAILTRVDLIRKVSEAVEIRHKEATVIVESILVSIVRAIHGGDKVEIRGFGRFSTRQ
jgi:integration host factor subunit beta